MTALRVKGLRKSYGRVRALDGFSMTLGPGEWVALLGPNGAGKTTLMRCIAGLSRPDGGSIELTVDGDSRDALGVVPQELAVYERLSARENLEVFGRIHGLRGRALQARVDWALEWTLLGDRADDLAGGFSGGMRRRLNIACGVLHGPRIVLLDEPTVGVDPQARSHIWAMLRQLRDDGAALLQSTHQIDEIESIADRAIVMDRGRDLASGTHAQLVAMTFGGGSDLRMWLDREPDGLALSNGFRLHGNRIDGPVTDVARELPELLDSLREAGVQVESMRVETPGLEAVFTALTGRELRE